MSMNEVSSRYEILTKLSAGGMATVYIGLRKGPFGFEQLVAIKRLHQHLLDDASVRESLLLEARVAARIRHANVVDVRDIETVNGAVQIILPFIEGTTLANLMTAEARGKTKLRPSIAIRVVLDICAGLHAAHELKDESGKPVGLVHRDVSPQNVLIGIDGISRITDFGVARAEIPGRLQTGTGMLKGKFAYMAPEYLHGQKPDRRHDVFALGVVLWEALAGKRLFKGASEGETLTRLTQMEVPRISSIVPELEELDDVILLALSRDPDTRFSTAQAFGAALETTATAAGLLATHAEVEAHVRDVASEELHRLEVDRKRALAMPSLSEIWGGLGKGQPASKPEEPPVRTVQSLNVPSLPLEVYDKRDAKDERLTLEVGDTLAGPDERPTVPDSKMAPPQSTTMRSAAVAEEDREGVKLVDPTPRIALLPMTRLGAAISPPREDGLPVASVTAPRTQSSPQQAPAASKTKDSPEQAPAELKTRNSPEQAPAGPKTQNSPEQAPAGPKTQNSPEQAPAAAKKPKTGPLGTAFMTPSPGLPADAFVEPTKHSAVVNMLPSARVDRPVEIHVASVSPEAFQTLPVSAARLNASVLPFATRKAAGSRAWPLMLALCVAIPGILLVIWRILGRP